jgi:hypothetical protein
MSKKLFIFLVAMMLIVIPASSIAAAPANIGAYSVPGPAGTFSSAFTVQNLGTAIANCTYQFFDAAGTAVVTSATFQIAIGGSSFTYVPNVAGLASGQYSAVVSCDQQVSAVVNTSSPNSGGSYGGINTTSTTWYAPNAFNNYYNFFTNFVVQNATGSPVDMTVQIIDPSGTIVATQTASAVPAYASHNFEQSGLAGLSANVAYSAKITGTGALAVESNIYGTGSVTNQLYSYTPFSGGSLTAYAPVVMKNYYGFSTALTVQNLGSATAHVTVTYGTGLVQTANVGVSASAVFYTPNTTLNNGTITSAKVTSDQNIVVLINETGNYLRAASFTAFSAGSMKVSVPIVLKHYYSYNTSITCQNVGTATTNITVTYNDGTTETLSNIAANGTALFYQPNNASLANGFNGSAMITSSSQPIVCVANEEQSDGTYATTSADLLFSYEGVPVP